jgi:hypothetical protein
VNPGSSGSKEEMDEQQNNGGAQRGDRDEGERGNLTCPRKQGL